MAVYIVTSPKERLRLAHKNLKQCLLENYQALSPLSSDTALAATVAKPIIDNLRPEVYKKEVYSNGTFTADWFTPNIPMLYKGIQKSGKSFSRFLEVGSFEGLSTCWFARLLSQSSTAPSITAVDLFSGNFTLGDLGKRFDANIKQFIRDIPVNKIQSDSARALSNLLQDKKEFDLIYVDGSHIALNVIVDASLCWRMLCNEGVIIFDDYFWFRAKDTKDVLHAVNAFLDLIEGEYEVLNVFYQVILQKKVSNPR